jgi:alpha-beta hydrolase superfamily lysophospholipase
MAEATMSNTNPPSSRRSFLKCVAPAIAGSFVSLGLAEQVLAQQPLQTSGAGNSETASAKPTIWSHDYWAQKGNGRLYMFRKRLHAPAAGQPALPVLFLVHGSSISSRSTFDLTVPGHGEYSMMNAFAEFGFDVWTMDFAGYGRSSPASGNSDIADGVRDLEAAMKVLERETGQQRFHFFGESSGALRAGAFAMAHSDRIHRLVMTAFTYTGAGSPTLAKRAEQVEYYRTHKLRVRDRKMIRSIFTRDKAGTTDPAVAEALANAELKFGDTVPTGTYLDMTAHLPIVDPQKLHAPVLIARGEYDGIASMEDLLNFFSKVASEERQFIVLAGAAHSLVLCSNRRQLWHITQAFLEMPPRRDALQETPA